MKTYLLISAIVLIILGLMWGKKNLLDFVVKLLLIGLGLCGLFYYLTQIGYIVKN